MPPRGKLKKPPPHRPEERKKAYRQGFAKLFGQEPMSGDDDDQGPYCVPAATSGTKRLDVSGLLNTWCPKDATMEGITRHTAMHEDVWSAAIDERPGELLRLVGVAHADIIEPLLRGLLDTHSLTDARLVGEAQAKANIRNRQTLEERDPDASIFRPNGQDFRGSGHISVTGGFPTSVVLDGPAADKLLGDGGNATVQTLSMLMGLPRGGKATQGTKIASNGGKRGGGRAVKRAKVDISSARKPIGKYRRAYKIKEGENEGKVKIGGWSTFYHYQDVRKQGSEERTLGLLQFDSNGSDKTLSNPIDENNNMVTGEWGDDPSKGLWNGDLIEYARAHVTKPTTATASAGP
eukprot:g16804.t1